jgi:hypothetical protein
VNPIYPNRRGIEPGSAARKAEEEKRAGAYPEVQDEGPKARMAAQGEVLGRSAYGFTLSSRVGKPFRFEETADSLRGEALPAQQATEAQEETPRIEINRKSFVPAVSQVEPPEQEDAAQRVSGSTFHALFGSLLNTLSFRKRT